MSSLLVLPGTVIRKLSGPTNRASTTVNFLDPATLRRIYVNMDNDVRSGLVGPFGGLGPTWNQMLAGSSVAGGNLLDASGPVTSVGYTTSGNA